MALDVTVYIAEARRGEPSILFAGRRRTPAEAAELARDLMAAADFAIGLDGTVVIEADTDPLVDELRRAAR